MSKPQRWSISLILLAASLLSSLSGAFSSYPVAAQSINQAAINLDGVSLILESPILPGKFTCAAAEDRIQMATAARLDDYQEVSLTVIPYGTQAVTEELPAASEGAAEDYRSQLFSQRATEGGNPISGPTAELFGQEITGILSVLSTQINAEAPQQIIVTEWVVEAGERIWILRINQLYETGTSLASVSNSLTQVKLSSSNVNTPSTSLAYEAALAAIPTPSAPEEPSVQALASDLPSPSWWDSECDYNHYLSGSGGIASYPLGASYRNVKACGPRPYFDGAPDVVVYFFSGAHGELEWECVELSMRFMYLAYGVAPYSGNGKDVVNNYPGTRLVKISNDTVGSYPKPGDILSYGTTGYGHTSVVTASSVNSSGTGTVTIMEQNNRASGTQTLTMTDWHVYASTIITGWLHDPDTITGITLSSSTITENLPAGTSVGSFSSQSSVSGATYTYQLVSGDGSDENIYFTISGSTLKTVLPFNHEVYDEYRIRVKSTSSLGGSFEKAFVITSINVNEAPTAIQLSNSLFSENCVSGTLIGSLTSSDEDTGDTHTYALVSGTNCSDNSLFSISGNSLLTSGAFNYEQKNSFNLCIQTQDSGGLTFTKAFTLNLLNVNEAPSGLDLSSTSIDEDQPIGAVVGSFTASDEDLSESFTYSLISGTGDNDNAHFSISGSQLLTAAALNATAQPELTIRVRVTDQGGAYFERQFTISVLNINLAPDDITLSSTVLNENSPVNTQIGTLSTHDIDPEDTHTYSLAAGTGSTDNASFSIQQNELLAAAVFNYEQKTSASIRIRSTDNSGLYVEKQFTISITDVNESPTNLTLSSSKITENQASGTLVGQFTTVDEDLNDTYTYQLISGSGDQDNGVFKISGSSLLTNAVFDYEARSSYSIRIRSTDGGGHAIEKSFTISILNSNDSPSNLTLSSTSLVENLAIGTNIGTFSTSDQDSGDSFTYQLVSGSGDSDNARFKISGSQLQVNALLNYESQSTYQIRVKTTDSSGASFTKSFTLNLINVNDAPTNLILNNNSVTEHQPIGTLIGELSVSDEDAGDFHLFELVSGPGDSSNGLFSVAGSLLRTDSDLNYDLQEFHSIRIRATDSGGLWVENSFTITVLDANQKPTDLLLNNNSIAENLPAATVIGTFSTIDPNLTDEHTYALVSGEGDSDNLIFKLEGANLQTLQTFNYETKNRYSIRARTTDLEGLYLEKIFTILVNDVNEPPTALTLSNTEINENIPAGSTIAALTTEDEDLNDLHTYTLTNGSGADDNSAFKIQNDTLLIQNSPDFEQKNSYKIRIRTSDSKGLYLDQTFTITIQNINEAPTAIQLSHAAIAENEPAGSDIGILTTTDQDFNDTHNYTFAAGTGDTDNNDFLIENDTLKAKLPFDYESRTSYEIRVRSTDAQGLYTEQTYRIEILPVNEYAPTGIFLSQNSIAENFPQEYEIGQLTALDQDQGDPHSFEILNPDGNFILQEDRLLSNAAFDFERQPSYTVIIRTTDSGGLTADQEFTISIEDRLETYLPLIIHFLP